MPVNDHGLFVDASDRERYDALLLQKYLDGELAGSELAEFETWLKADEEHRALLISICIQQAFAPRLFLQEDGSTSEDSEELDRLGLEASNSAIDTSVAKAVEAEGATEGAGGRKSETKEW